jgi:hypothetical protein
MPLICFEEQRQITENGRRDDQPPLNLEKSKNQRARNVSRNMRLFWVCYLTLLMSLLLPQSFRLHVCIYTVKLT